MPIFYELLAVANNPNTLYVSSEKCGVVVILSSKKCAFLLFLSSEKCGVVEVLFSKKSDFMLFMSSKKCGVPVFLSSKKCAFFYFYPQKSVKPYCLSYKTTSVLGSKGNEKGCVIWTNICVILACEIIIFTTFA